MGLLVAFISLSCLASATESDVQLPPTRIHERTHAHTCLRLKLAPPLPSWIPESAQKCRLASEASDVNMKKICLRGGGRGADKVLNEAINGTRQRSVPVTLTTDWRRTPDGGAYSEIIDVRTPAEYAEDHIPGAVNLAVLSDAQRHEVGLAYANMHFEGRKLGASLISANIAEILTQHFLDKPQSYFPLVYCWRGGQRSHSLAHILSQIGFRCSILQGGYREYRRHAVAVIEEVAGKLSQALRVLTGPTGCGKTRVLHYLATEGHQVVDLEALAHHRGSVLGALPVPQPSQKWFESLLARELEQLDALRPVFVEDEAPYIGSIHLPPALWHRMLAAPRFLLEMPLHLRVGYTLEEYAHLTNHTQAQHLKQCLEKLAKHHSESTMCAWMALIDEHKYAELVGELLVKHYDPANCRSIARRRNKHNVIHIRVSGLEEEALERDLPPSSPLFAPLIQVVVRATAETSTAETSLVEPLLHMRKVQQEEQSDGESASVGQEKSGGESALGESASWIACEDEGTGSVAWVCGEGEREAGCGGRGARATRGAPVLTAHSVCGWQESGERRGRGRALEEGGVRGEAREESGERRSCGRQQHTDSCMEEERKRWEGAKRKWVSEREMLVWDKERLEEDKERLEEEQLVLQRALQTLEDKVHALETQAAGEADICRSAMLQTRVLEKEKDRALDKARARIRSLEADAVLAAKCVATCSSPPNSVINCTRPLEPLGPACQGGDMSPDKQVDESVSKTWVGVF